MAVATWNQVAVALGRPASAFTTDQQAQITWWLDGVELIIKDRLGPIAGLDQDAVKFVEVEAVAAKVPPVGSRGESSITVTADDGSVTRRWDSPVSSADVTDAWWSLLSPGVDHSAFTIRPGSSRRRRALNATSECW